MSENFYSELKLAERRIVTADHQIMILNMRNEAFETLMFRPLSLLIGIFSPHTMLKKVNALQLKLIEKHNEIRERHRS